MESTDGLLIIHNPTDDTLLIFELLKAISRNNVQVGNSAANNTWQADHLSCDLSALVSERLSQRLIHPSNIHGTPGPIRVIAD